VFRADTRPDPFERTSLTLESEVPFMWAWLVCRSKPSATKRSSKSVNEFANIDSTARFRKPSRLLNGRTTDTKGTFVDYIMRKCRKLGWG
jgi:hypothetical protein